MPFIDKSPLQYPINSASSVRRWNDTRAPTNADYKQFRIGDEWLDSSSDDWWKLCYKDNTQGIWRIMCGTATAAELFTPDSGGQTGPDALNNVNWLGDSAGYQNGIHFTGDPANNTLTAMDLRNITVYVVDAVAGQTEYQTIQAAIDAANAAGGGTVYIRPGLYVEDLVLYNQVDLTGAVASAGSQLVTITGTHVPPLAGAISFRNIAFREATAIFNSAAAGTTLMVATYCFFIVTNGYTFNIPNWVGLVAVLDCHSFGVQDGFVDMGAGGGTLTALNCTVGVGGTNIMAVSGATRINNCNIQCNLDTTLQGITVLRGCQWNLTLLFSDDSNGSISQCMCFQDVGTAINHTSTGIVSITNTTIESSGNPDVIAGTGDVQLDVVFTISAAINAGITQLAPAYHVSGPIEIIPEDSSVAAEDAWIKFNIPAGGGFSNGIDNSDTDNFKLTDGIDPSNGTEYYSLDVAASRWEFPINIFEQEISNEGGAVSHFISNTENTDPASDAACQILTGGASGGDPFLHLEVESVQEFSFGIDNSDSDVLCITDGGSPSAGTEFWRMTIAGERTLPLQPAFLAYNADHLINQTGNGAVATVTYDVEVFDQNADYNNGTYTFTAPVTGKYRFSSCVLTDAVTAAMVRGWFLLVTSNQTYYFDYTNPGVVKATDDQVMFQGSMICDMDATDTVYLTLTIANGVGDTATIMGDIGGNEVTWFSGQLEC